MQAPRTLAHAQSLVREGRWREALPLYESLAADARCDALVIRQLAELEIVAGRHAQAHARLGSLDLARDAEADYLMARAEEGLGQLDSALHRLEKLRLRLGKPQAQIELQVGIVHERRGERMRAEQAMRAAIALEPALTVAHKRLATMLFGAGDAAAARGVLESALAATPRDANLWLRLASVQMHEGASGAVLASLKRAMEADSRDPETWTGVGHLYAEFWMYEQAEAALVRAASLDPGRTDTESLLSLVKQETGDNGGALQALARATTRDPGDLRVAFAERLFLPQAYDDAQQMRAWRGRFMAGLASLERDAGRWRQRAADVFSLERNNFFLAYQGENDLEPQRRHAALLADLVATAAPHLRAPLPVRFDARRRLRVGFVGNIFRDCTAGRYFERWITGLDAQRFERFAYHLAPLSDEFTARIAASCEQFFAPRVDARAMGELIRSHELDVLVHPEVGMMTMSYLLAVMRLAPVQCVGWGHPVTTGSDAIDHYFTCAAMEPVNAPSHYVEPLVPLPGIGVSYAMPQPETAFDRAQLGWSVDAHVYVCAQSLFKVHPEMDDVFARIAEADPAAMLVFFQAPSRAVSELVASRMQAALAHRGVAPRGQVKLLPRMNGAQFRSVLASADVVLDTFRWSGGNTSIDAFAAGVPVVTLAGEFMRGRQTSAMLEMMDVKSLIARDADEYVAIATGIAADRGRARALRAAIEARREVLFERGEPLEAWREALLRVGRAGGPD
jgi:CRISPR-associated protein Csy1